MRVSGWAAGGAGERRERERRSKNTRGKVGKREWDVREHKKERKIQRAYLFAARVVCLSGPT